MSKLLVIFTGNWADEMDVEGFMFVSEAAWEYKQKEWANTEFPVELGIGTNEELEYEKLSEYISEFKIQKVTEEEEQLIRKLFNMNSKWSDFGHVPWIEGNANNAFYEEHGSCPD